MDKTIYTIGYSAFNIDAFLTQLKSFNIGCVIDVRSIPVASEFMKIYSKNSLAPLLQKNSILYRNYALEFGARQENPKYYETYGYLDFEAYIKTDTFASGVEKIKKGMALGYKFCLMCAEKDPITCHRAIMVSRGLQTAGLNVWHIMSDGMLQSQQTLENRLLNQYFPDRNQQNLFSQNCDQDYLNEAYRKQNAKIGFA